MYDDHGKKDGESFHRILSSANLNLQESLKNLQACSRGAMARPQTSSNTPFDKHQNRLRGAREMEKQRQERILSRHRGRSFAENEAYRLRTQATIPAATLRGLNSAVALGLKRKTASEKARQENNARREAAEQQEATYL